MSGTDWEPLPWQQRIIDLWLSGEEVVIAIPRAPGKQAMLDLARALAALEQRAGDAE